MSAKTARVICTGRFPLHPFSLQSKRRSPNAVLFHHLREAYGLFPQARKARRRRDPGLFLQQAHGPQTHPPAHPPPARPAHRTGTCTGLPWKVQRRAFRRPACCRATRNATAVCVSHRYPSASYRARISSAPARHRHSRRQRSPGWRKHFGGHGVMPMLRQLTHPSRHRCRILCYMVQKALQVRGHKNVHGRRGRFVERAAAS